MRSMWRPRWRRRVIAAVFSAALMTGVVGAQSALAAPVLGEIRQVGAATIVPDSYVVLLKDGAGLRRDGVDATERGLLSRYRGKSGRTFRHAVKGFETSMTETAARMLAADPAVASVEPNVILRGTGIDLNPQSWGLDRVDQRALPLDGRFAYPGTGFGVTAYIIDSGIRFSHSEFGGRAVSGFDAFGTGPAVDCHGHGTHVAGTVGGSTFGVAKAVSLVAVRVLDCANGGTTATVLAGIDWVTANHFSGNEAVANMSINAGSINTAVNTAVANSIADGITYVVSAGNSNIDACKNTPAQVPAAITVGAAESNDHRASYSNWGSCVDIFAPGSDIRSASHRNDADSVLMTGTSMAAPHVTGAAALVLGRNPRFTPEKVRNYLVNIASTGRLTDVGTGSPNALLFVDNGPPPDDFSMSLSTVRETVPAGGKVEVTVQTSITRGVSQTVDLSAVNDGGWGSHHFTSSRVASGRASTLIITTPTTIAARTYVFTIHGIGTWASRSVQYSLTITPASPCRGQMLLNPGFETPGAYWKATANVLTIPGPAPRTGNEMAFLNGYGTTHTDTLSQAVTLPAGCGTYQLSFWLRVISSEATNISHDTLAVQVIRGTTTTLLTKLSNMDEGVGYGQYVLDLSAFAGKTITVKFVGKEDGNLDTAFIIDDVALSVLA